MTIWVARHACAGRKRDWTDDDRKRPLDAVGQRQAEAIAEQLAGRGPLRMRSSPTQRCIDTLAPLADRLGVPVVEDLTLLPGGHPGGLCALVHEAEPGDLLCTHGEVMNPVIAAVRRLQPDAALLDDEQLTAKGIVWELELVPGSLQLLTPVSTCPDHT